MKESDLKLRKSRFSLLRSVLIVIVLIIFVMIGAFIKAQSNLKKLASIEISDVNLSEIEDGYYEGSYNVFPISVDVSVFVKNHELKDIRIIKHDNGQGSSAEKITELILKSQSLNVDIISGATYSSKVIIKAVENALE